MASGYRRPAPRVPSGPPRLTPGSFRHATSVTPERTPAARAASSPELLTSPEYQWLVPFIFSITRLHLSSHTLRPALCAPSSGWFVEALRECVLLHTSASTLQDLRQLSWLKPFIQLDPGAFSGRTVKVTEQRGDDASNNVAKHLVEFSSGIPRERLRPSYGSGFAGAPLWGGTPRELVRGERGGGGGDARGEEGEGPRGAR